MRNSKAALYTFRFLMILATCWSMACSVKSVSQASSKEHDLARQSSDFKECVISTVLKGSTMQDSKASCLRQAQKACDLKPATKSSCLDLVSSATQKVMDQGQSVDCDSGFCTIIYK